MNLVPDIVNYAPELTRIRRDLHAHPEVGFEETRTSALVAGLLTDWGVEVHRGIGGTGVVGVIRGQGPGRCIGLRADMDALPMTEATGLPHASLHPGAFHGCGHDGHTTMLLGAARYLAHRRRFPGEVVLIFQPAEEGLGGARRMLADGLFERFPCDEIYALHNWPGVPLGRVSLTPGVAMAAADTFDIAVVGQGAHGAQPHLSIDPVMAVATLAQALQTIVSRNIDPLRAAVISVTIMQAGTAANVIPDTARLGGTIRTFDEDVRAFVARRMTTLAHSIAEAFGARAEVGIQQRFSVLRNSEVQAQAAMAVARTVVGPSLAEFDREPLTGSEDFADMLAVVPGAYLLLGQGDGPALHNPRYDFQDSATPIGASLLAHLAETRAAA